MGILYFEEDLIERIKESNNIVDIISESVKLKRVGSNYQGLCPFHSEKTPSFNVNPERNLYYCFGCGAGGNAFNFLMAIDNISFQEALKILALKAGINLSQDNYSNYRQQNEKREELFAAYNLASKFYQHVLFSTKIGEIGRGYLKERGYPLGFSKTMGLGMAPPGWDHLFKLLMKKGFSPETLAEGGLIVPRNSGRGYYDRFRDRLMFTIHNNRNQAIAFGGRLIKETPDQPKYLNSPETLLFDKSQNLYGLNWARKTIGETDRIVIVEGYTDVLTAHLNGLTNCVALLGTALSKDHAKIIKRLTSNVYISLDSDEAGQSAARRSLDILLAEGLKVFIVDYKEDTDPDSFIRNYGPEVFQQRLDASKIYAIHLIDQICREYDISTSLGRIEAGQECVNILKDVPDLVEREIYLQYVAKKLQLTSDALGKEVAKNITVKSKNKDNKASNWHTNDNQPKKTFKYGLEERILAGLLEVSKPNDYLSSLNTASFKNPLTRELVEKLRQNVSLDDLLLDDSHTLHEFIAYLGTKEFSGSLADYILKFKMREITEKKENILMQLRETNSLDLSGLNSKLCLYGKILKL